MQSFPLIHIGHKSLNYWPSNIVTCHHHCYCCNVFSNVIYCFSFADNFKWDLFLRKMKANEIFQAMTNLKGDCRTIEAKASRSMVRVLTRRQLMVRDAGWPLCLPCSPQSALFLLLLSSSFSDMQKLRGQLRAWDAGPYACCLFSIKCSLQPPPPSQTGKNAQIVQIYFY